MIVILIVVSTGREHRVGTLSSVMLNCAFMSVNLAVCARHAAGCGKASPLAARTQRGAWGGQGSERTAVILVLQQLKR